MGDYYVSNPVKLIFDPATTLDSEVHEIFEDEIARTLWMGIKIGHIVDQHFNRGCLAAAEHIRKGASQLQSVSELQRIIAGYLDGSYIHVAEELFPYVTGQKKLNYEIVRDIRVA